MNRLPPCAHAWVQDRVREIRSRETIVEWMKRIG
jgi:hypothetical protein